MAVDEVLLHWAAAEGGCAWRFYQWAEATLSLGYFQSVSDRQKHPPSRNCPLVRRASGGGAIIHDIELTYSFVVSAEHALSFGRRRLYDAVHAVLVETLAEFGVEASLFEAANPSRTCENPFLCFQRRSPGDVVVESGHKVAGSAQRRLGGAILQHGSVLLDCSPTAPELPGLNQFGRHKIKIEELIASWRQRIERELLLEFDSDRLTDDELADARRIAEEKYAADIWTEFRGRD